MPLPKEDPEFLQQQAKLKKAMEEIKDVLRQHDIMGYVVLNDTKAAEFLLHLATSWSVAFCDDIDGQPAIRIRSKLSDYNGNKAEQKRCLEATIGAFFGLIHNLTRHRQNYADVIGMIAQHFPDVANIIEEIEPDTLQH